MNTDEKLFLIKRNLQEVTSEDTMRKIIDERSLKIYWGTAITGRPHIAYFLPIMKLRDFIKAGCTVKILLADIHGFLDNLKAPMDKIELRIVYYEKLLKAMLSSLGVDLNSVHFIKGSSYQQSKSYMIDSFKMAKNTTIGDLKRAGSQVVKQTASPLLSSLIYPNMQALDEEFLDVDAEFGGVDQRKIFMHAAKHMKRIGYNKRAYLMNPMMPGLNSEKMSSSDELGKIDLLDSSETIHAKISKCMDASCSGILIIFKFIIFPMEKNDIIVKNVLYANYEDLASGFLEKKFDVEELKQACISSIDKILDPVRLTMAGEEELIRNAY
ncbi:tyrosyl-tRNA synthetase [Enteropsectra breve]|nr:tyrosyl-tRNA synthetase [Enteropsectra breve]